MKIKSFKDLVVWQKSRIITKYIYKLCVSFPADEKFGLSSQMKRSAISIPSNIAEGFRRNSRKEYRQFLGVALGSAAELETQLFLASDLFSINTDKLIADVEEIEKILAAIISKLQPTGPEP